MKTKLVERIRGGTVCAILAAGLLPPESHAAANVEPAFSQACAAGPEEIAEYRAPIQWNDGLLQFACARLEDVLEEYNRHSSVKVVVRDSALRDVLIGGAFRTGDTEAFANGLERVFGLQTHRRGDTVRISRVDDALSLTSQTVSTYSPDRARTRVGVGEAVVVTASTEVDWTLVGEGSLSAAHGKRTTFTASDHASTPVVTAEANGKTASITFTVIEPERETVIRKEELWYPGHCLGAGMLLALRVEPPDRLLHHPSEGWTALLEDNTTRDTAMLVGADPPWTDGSFTWPIPGKWRAKGSRNEGDFPVTAQTFLLDAAIHTVTITKFGETVSRSASQAAVTPERQGKCRSEENNRGLGTRAGRGAFR